VASVAEHGCLSALDLLRPAGGTLLVPKGVWQCPPMNLTSNTVVYLEGGATLKANTSANWPLYGPLSIYGQGHDHPGPRRAPFLGGFDVMNVTIGGEDGTIDGSGFFWWREGDFGKQEKYTRPSLFECVRCADLTMQDVTFSHSSFWTIHPVLSRRVTARRIKVLNPATVPNTDGFDPDSTSDVLLEDSYFHVNDDAIAIKGAWRTRTRTLAPTLALALAQAWRSPSWPCAQPVSWLGLRWLRRRRAVRQHHHPQPHRVAWGWRNFDWVRGTHARNHAPTHARAHSRALCVHACARSCTHR